MKSRRFLSRTRDNLAWPNLAIRRAGISESQISETFVTFALFVVRKCFVESQPKILQIERERIKTGSNIHKPAQVLRYHNSLHSSCTTLSGGLTILSLIMAAIAHPTHTARDTNERK